MSTRPRSITTSAALLAAILIGAPAFALRSDPPASPPASPPADKPADPAKGKGDAPATPDASPSENPDGAQGDGTDGAQGDDDALPGLDELLGLPSGDKPADAEARKLFEDLDPNKAELERKLTAQEAADKLESAVQQMQETAFRIEKVRDTGIVTQRIQTEIIGKLDVLIKQAENSSSSSSSSSSQQQQQQMQQGEQQSQAAQQSQQDASQHNNGPHAPGGLPGFQSNPGDQLDSAKAAWGALPERVRDKLIEGTSDYFSEFYKAMTEAYYKRLAEEAGQ